MRYWGIICTRMSWRSSKYITAFLIRGGICYAVLMCSGNNHTNRLSSFAHAASRCRSRWTMNQCCRSIWFIGLNSRNCIVLLWISNHRSSDVISCCMCFLHSLFIIRPTSSAIVCALLHSLFSPSSLIGNHKNSEQTIGWSLFLFVRFLI